MKTSLIAFFLAGIASIAHSETPDDSADTLARKGPQWNVRVEVLMVALPQAKALPLISELRDPAKIEAAVAKIFTAIERKEAILTGYPMLQVLDGEHGKSDDTVEKRFPESFDPGTPTPPAENSPAPAPSAYKQEILSSIPVPTDFEVSSLGVTLEASPRVPGNGEWIDLSVVPQRVVLLGMLPFDAAKLPDGTVAKIEQPILGTTKVTSSLKIRNGQRSLIGIHLLTSPENHLELFILQASATPIK